MLRKSSCMFLRTLAGAVLAVAFACPRADFRRTGCSIASYSPNQSLRQDHHSKKRELTDDIGQTNGLGSCNNLAGAWRDSRAPHAWITSDWQFPWDKNYQMSALVADVEALRASLGVRCPDRGIVMEVTKDQTGTYAGAGFGASDKPSFWIGTGDHLSGPLHVAFTASTRAEVDAFYKAALSVGGRDNGAPGVRAHYHPNYYGAFVLDPDGNNVEAVCHSPA